MLTRQEQDVQTYRRLYHEALERLAKDAELEAAFAAACNVSDGVADKGVQTDRDCADLSVQTDETGPVRETTVYDRVVAVDGKYVWSVADSPDLTTAIQVHRTTTRYDKPDGGYRYDHRYWVTRDGEILLAEKHASRSAKMLRIYLAQRFGAA